jgi:hypothetical protein
MGLRGSMTRFLLKCWLTLRASIRRIGGGPLPVRPSETVARFLLQASHFAATKRLVKPHSFLPTKGGETSVYRTDSLTAEQVWGLARTHVERGSSRRVRARADIQAEAVYNQGLIFDPDGKPDLRHANIVGWPSGKDRQLLIALELARAATLRLPNGR